MKSQHIKAIINAAIALEREPDDFQTLRAKLEEAHEQLRAFWAAKDRPWMCRVCSNNGDGKGLLLPFGKNDFRCDDCQATYKLGTPYP